MIPSDRDLPPAVSARTRARLVAEVSSAPRSPRRWIPVAAAGAVLAAVTVPAVLLGGNGGAPGPPSGARPTPTAPVLIPDGSGGVRISLPPGYPTPPPRPVHKATPWTPAPNPSHTLPSDATVVDRCLDGADEGFATGIRLRALFTDDRGYAVFAGTKDKTIYCAFAWDGSVDYRGAQIEGTIAAPGGYAKAGAQAGLGGLDDMIDGTTSRLPGSDRTLYSALFYGLVTKDVASVTFAANGSAPARADIRDGSFVVRVVFHSSTGRTTGLFTSYDAAGKKIGTLRLIG